MREPKEENHDRLEEIRERRKLASASWDEIQSEAKKDRLCVAGRPWEALDPEGLKQRTNAKRPALALDKIGQYINQTVNTERANPRGIRFAPTGNGANDAGAEFYQNHTREIEYRSHAQMAYCTALDNAVTASYGWVRITAERQHVRTFNQDLWIKPIMNPDQVLPDPNAVWPDSRDMTHLFYIEPWQIGEFQRVFPKATIKSFAPHLKRLANQWISANQIQVAEYWTLESFKRRLVAFQHPDGRFVTSLVDELPAGKVPEGVVNLREEEVDDTRVKAWLTNGLELLDEIPWKGKHIPFVSCFGKILYVDDGAGSQRKLMSLTRLARDPYMLSCYIRTCQAEACGATTRATWSIYKGQATKPDEIAKANKEPVPYIEWELKTPETPPGTILPKGEKIQWDPPLQNLEAFAESIESRSIQAAMGIMALPVPMQTEQQKSGVAMDKLTSAYQMGSFHFKDHYNLMIERCGVILEDAITPYLDATRDVPVRLPNETGDMVHINDPLGSVLGPNGQLSGDPIFTKGDYRVTVSTGPNTESQRKEASEFLDGLVDNAQALAPILGPQRTAALLAKATKGKQLGALGDEVIEILAPQQPLGKDGKPLPPEVQALMQNVQQLQQQVQQLTHEKEVEQVKWNNQKDIERMKIDATDAKSQRDDQTKLAIAGLTERVDRMALLVDERKHGRELVHKAREGVKTRLHDINRAHQDHRADLATQIHTHGHQKKLAETQGAVKAALAARNGSPSPEPTAAA